MLLYRRTMDRVWGITLLLGFVLLALWWFGLAFTPFYRAGWLDTLTLLGGIISLMVGVFAFFGRYLSYVQANADHLLIRTPFIRLITSYRRVLGIRSTEFHRLFDPEQFSWSERNYLDPFIGSTAVIVHLRDYPFSPRLLRLFFPKFMLSPREKGFVLLVPDWMAFSLEADSRFSAWLQTQQAKTRPTGFQRGMYRQD